MTATETNIVKPCYVCRAVKPVTDFYAKCGACKKCENARKKERYATDPEYRERIRRSVKQNASTPENRQSIREYQQQWRANPEHRARKNLLEQRRLEQPDKRVKALICGVRHRSNANGIPFDPEIINDLLPAPTFCPFTGKPIDYARGKGTGNGRTCGPSIDKLIPALGYVHGNVIVASMEANGKKQNSTPADFAAFLLFTSNDPIQALADVWASNAAIQERDYRRYLIEGNHNVA